MSGNKELLEHWLTMLKSVHNISHWLLAADGTILASGSEDDIFFQELFSIGPCRDYLPDHFKRSHYPLLMHDNFDILWLAGKKELDSDGYVIYLLGPIYEPGVSIREMDRLCNAAANSPELAVALPARLRRIPVLDRAVLQEYGILLHHCLSGDIIPPFQMQERIVAESRHITELSERLLWHGTWKMESELMRCVEEGNMNYRAALAGLTRQGQVGILSDGDPLRQAKNELIVFTTLCTRAAIRSGLSPESGYAIGDHFIKCGEACTSVSEVYQHLANMFDACVNRVHELKKERNVSPSTRMAIDYIIDHIWEKVRLEEMAKELGYAEYYLSGKFQKEMGKSINQFVNEKKIELAKKLLRMPNYSTAEISDALSFSSPSYFCSVFRKVTGMTPMKYVEGHRRE